MVVLLNLRQQRPYLYPPAVLLVKTLLGQVVLQSSTWIHVKGKTNMKDPWNVQELWSLQDEMMEWHQDYGTLSPLLTDNLGADCSYSPDPTC